MKFSYYPGCTLKTKAVKLDEYARQSAAMLGFELEELPAWQCCGTVYPQAADEIGARLSSVRALSAAADQNQALVTLCSACHQVLKRVNQDMKENQDISDRANRYLKLPKSYQGETQVLHYLEVLSRIVGLETLKAQVKVPLTGLKIGAYYGCLLLRPSDCMQFDDPENPVMIEAFIRALGAEPVLYPYRNECCGGYLSLKEPDGAGAMAKRVLMDAAGHGADLLITACPLCQYNLSANQPEPALPVIYFTELLAMALGIIERTV